MRADNTLSLRGLARLMGCDEKAIRKALAVGVFTEDSIRRDADGAPVVVNATLAVSQWEKSGRQLRGSVVRAQAPAAAPAPAAPGPSAPPQPLIDASPSLEPVGELGDEDAGDVTLVDAQRDVMLERRRKMRLENDLREGLLVEVDRAAREGFEFARTIREAVMNIPARLAAELAAESDEGRVYSRLDAALREALHATVKILDAPPAEEAAPRG